MIELEDLQETENVPIEIVRIDIEENDLIVIVNENENENIGVVEEIGRRNRERQGKRGRRRGREGGVRVQVGDEFGLGWDWVRVWEMKRGLTCTLMSCFCLNSLSTSSHALSITVLSSPFEPIR